MAKIRPRRRSRFVFFLITALAAQGPVFGQVALQILRLPAASSPSAGAASAGGASWSGLTSAELRTALPGLSLLAPSGAAGNPIVASLARLLEAADVPPAALVAPTPAAQAEAIRPRVAAVLRSLAQAAQGSPAGADAPLSDQILDLDRLRSSLEDARLCLPFVLADGDPRLLDRLEAGQSAVESRLAEKKQAMVLRMIEESRDWDAPAWHGRTAVFSLPEGHALAVKFQKNSRDSLSDEEKGMRRASRVGVAAPVSLGVAKASSPEATQWLNRLMNGNGQFLPYLIPARDAGNFFSYLGARLPTDSKEKARAAVAAAADRSMRDLIRLADHGLVHESLAPLSHSAVDWSWDFLRWSFFRHGPSSIHSWKSGLSFPNLRMSGIADFEHIGEFDSTVVGQNLTEWALLVMSAGAANAIPARAAADILWNGFKLHAAGRIDPNAYALDLGRLHGLLRSAVRRFYRFERLSRLLPRWLVEYHNSSISGSSSRDIRRGEPLVMSGAVVQTLVVRAVFPYVSALDEEDLGRWGDLNYTEHVVLSSGSSVGQMLISGVLLAIPAVFALAIGVIIASSPSAAALKVPSLLAVGLLALPAVVPTLRALSDLLARALIPRWIRPRPSRSR
jgi:hypothetical protein